MNKKDLKKIENIAEKLPAIKEWVTVVATGRQLLEEERFEHVRKMIDFKPSIITPVKKYKIKVPEGTVNHYRRMKEAFKKQGWKGVNLYLLPFIPEEDKKNIKVENQ
jgi:hypothetical protein